MAKKKGRPKQGATPVGAKSPVSGAEVAGAKVPVPGASVGDEDPFIIWGFSLLDLEGPWGWSKLAPSDFAAVLAKLAEWERLRHNEVFAASGNKPIPREKLVPEAQKRLRRINLGQVDELWELRLSGKRRIWGWREQHVFYPIWWDPEHKVCPSQRR